MIDKLSLSAEWINLKQTEFKKDPSYWKHDPCFISAGEKNFYQSETIRL